MKTKSRHRVAAALLGGLCAILVLAIAALQARDIVADQTSAALMAESNERTRRIGDYLAHLLDLETGQRGYVVTGNPEFLEPAEAALARLPQLSRELRGQYRDGSREQQLVTGLLAAGTEKARYSRQVVATRRAGRADNAAALVRNRHGKAMMDRARALSAPLLQGERLNAQGILVGNAEARATRYRLIVAAEVALLLAAAALLTLLLLTLRSLDRASQSLHDSAARQEAIFAHASDAMLMLDREGIVVSVNAAAERLFGHSAAEMVGRSNLLLFADPPTPEESRAYLKGLALGVAAAKPSQSFTGRRRDGTEFQTEVVTTAVPLHGGLQYLAVGRDITERTQVERMKTEFVATVSHELRTPLASISGALGLLAGNAANQLTDGARRLVEIALNNSHRLIRLINDMLDLEKIEAGKMEFDVQRLSLAPLLAQAIDSNTGFAVERRIELRLDPVPDDAAIMGDGDRLQQVFTNLLSNAVKFSPPGAVVDLTATEHDGGWRVSVRDRGPGIAEKFRDRIFGKFSQADAADSRVHGGSGLGLSIAREIVTRLEGTIGFDTVIGAGTVFHVDLPAAPVLAPQDEAPVQRQPIAADGRRHFLHIEDDADALRVVGEAFAHLAEVHVSPSIAEAKAALRRYWFDAILLDIALADGSGLDLLPLIRKANPGAPVILFTAADVGPGIHAMVDAVGVKSRTPLEELASRVKELLARPSGAVAA